MKEVNRWRMSIDHNGDEPNVYPVLDGTVHFEGSDKFLYADCKVTHAAKVNMPSENKIKPAVEEALSQVLARLVKQEVSAAFKEYGVEK